MRNFLSPLLLICGLSTGCTYTNAVSLTNIPSERTNVVEAEVSKTIFLAFNFDNDHVYRLVNDLKAKCPNGDVKGIQTKDSSTMYFLFFVWNRSTEAKGYCVPSTSKSLSNAEIEASGVLSAATAPEENAQ